MQIYIERKFRIHLFYKTLFQKASWSQGMNLGGSSNLNFMMHLRGSPRDYDHWSQVHTYKLRKHYFKKYTYNLTIVLLDNWG